MVSSDGIVAVYSCNPGYSLKGIFSRNCTANGSGWDGITPSCGIYSIIFQSVNINLSFSTLQLVKLDGCKQ